MRLYKLDKTVLHFKNNAIQMLNGLTSNTMKAERNAFLNIHGRIIATFDQIKLNDNECLMVVGRAFVEPVMQHIDRFVKLSGVIVEEMPFQVFFDLEGDYPLDKGEYAIPQKKGRLILTGKSGSPNVDEAAFTLFRVRNNIPLHGKDYTDDFLLNVSVTEFASFTKGCFLGQEPVSKVYNRSKPTWKLQIRSEDECEADEKTRMTSKIFDPEHNKVRGFVFIKNEAMTV